MNRFLLALFAALMLLLSGCVVVPLKRGPPPVSRSQVGQTVEFRYVEWRQLSTTNLTGLPDDAFFECRGRYGEPAFCLSHAEQASMDQSRLFSKALLTCVIKAPIFAECTLQGGRATTAETKGQIARRQQAYAQAETLNIGIGAWQAGKRIFRSDAGANAAEECRENADDIRGTMHLLCVPAHEVPRIYGKKGRMTCVRRGQGSDEWSCSAFNKPVRTELWTGNKLMEHRDFLLQKKVTVKYYEYDCRIIAHTVAPYCIPHKEMRKKSRSQLYTFSWDDAAGIETGGVWLGRRVLTK